jgi:hypothetical protein
VVHKGKTQVVGTEDFLKWYFYIGIKNGKGKPLTEDQLRKWSIDPKRLLECGYCGTTYPVYTFSCSHCKEYKGMSPYIPEWSDWG